MRIYKYNENTRQLEYVVFNLIVPLHVRLVKHKALGEDEVNQLLREAFGNSILSHMPINNIRRGA